MSVKTYCAGVCLIAVVGAGCSGSSSSPHVVPGSRPSTSARVASSAWAVYSLPRGIAERGLVAYAQIDDTRALAYGGVSVTTAKRVQYNNGVVVDLLTGTMTDLAGPDVRGGLARASAVTESASARVAVAGLQCESPDEDPKYADLAANDQASDGCSPGPLTISVYDGEHGAWSRPSEAPYDYGQSFRPTIIGFVDGRVYVDVSDFTENGRNYAIDGQVERYVSFDVSSGDWRRIAAPPSDLYPCRGMAQVVGLSYGTIETYDAAGDTWSTRRIPVLPSVRVPSGGLDYEWACLEHYIVLHKPFHNKYIAYSVDDGRWIAVPAPPVDQSQVGLVFTAGDTLLRWNQNILDPDTSPGSITIGMDPRWQTRIDPPKAVSTVASINLRPYAHAGTRIVAFDGGTVLTADLARLAGSRS